MGVTMITDLVQGLDFKSAPEFSIDPLDNLTDFATDNLMLNLQANSHQALPLPCLIYQAFKNSNRNVNQLLKDYALMRHGHRVWGIASAVYAVQIENISKHKGNIPWFNDKNLCYLATEADLSLGSNESESFYAGAYQANYLTQKSSDETEVTFIETAGGNIAKSYSACRKLVFNKDGTVNEPARYAFKLTVSLLNPKDTHKTAISKSWLVGVKSASTEVSSSGRSEVVKINVTFQKLRPMLFG